MVHIAGEEPADSGSGGCVCSKAEIIDILKEGIYCVDGCLVGWFWFPLVCFCFICMLYVTHSLHWPRHISRLSLSAPWRHLFLVTGAIINNNKQQVAATLIKMDGRGNTSRSSSILVISHSSLFLFSLILSSVTHRDLSLSQVSKYASSSEH